MVKQASAARKAGAISPPPRRHQYCQAASLRPLTVASTTALLGQLSQYPTSTRFRLQTNEQTSRKAAPLLSAGA